MTIAARVSNQLTARILGACIRMLPERTQRVASKHYFFRQIRNRRFASSEIEWRRLNNWLRPGDWCIDVGANIGRYSLRMSDLVGPLGHVIAFEPFTRSFELLTHFVEKGRYRNITLLNAAATDHSGLISIAPDFTPLVPYLFHTNTATRISKGAESTSEKKLGLSIDALGVQQVIRLIKVDVEGHELAVCKGMVGMIQRDHPILIIEDHDTGTGVAEFLAELGYQGKRLAAGSRNLLFTTMAS